MRERIVIVRVAALGDIVSTSVLLARVRTERPGAHVTWVCGQAAVPIVEMFDGVDEIVPVDDERLFRGTVAERLGEMLRVWRTLAGRRFDLALVVHADPRYRLLLAASRVRRLRRLVRTGDRTPPLRVRFWGDEYARLLDEGAEHGPVERRYEIADVRPRLDQAPAQPLDATQTAPLVCLVPGGARNVLRDDPHRRWPAAHYADVARRLGDAGYSVALIGGANDEWVRPYFSGMPVEDQIGRTSLRETLMLLRRASLVITHDTGPLHLARLVRARIVALFGPTVPLETVGVDKSITVLWGGERLACRPCYNGLSYAECDDNVCMSEIHPDIVTRTALSILSSERAAAPGIETPAQLAAAPEADRTGRS